jgi:predicted transcriptional regulator
VYFANQGVRMSKRKKPHATTIRVDPDLWERIEQLARADRRPVASYLKLVIADAISAESGQAAA